MKALVFLFLALAAVQLHAQSQLKFFSSPNTAPPLCVAAGNALLAGLHQFPHPANWTYVILCDDAAWTHFMAAAHKAQSEYIHGLTNPKIATTFLRGSTLRGESALVSSDHLIAHELAHIYLDSNNEDLVEIQALAWMKQRGMN